MLILGVNSLYHESSACLIRDGELVAAAEEERFNRLKHGKQMRADNPDELPVHAIDFCLKTAGIKPADIQHIAIAGNPELMNRVYRTRAPAPWSEREDHATFLDKLNDVEGAFEKLDMAAPLHWIGHHEAHAASALHFSGFDDAAVLVVDALGDDAYSTLSASANKGQLDPILRVAYPASIGYLWELVSVYLGFSIYHAAKVMGLAAYGNRKKFQNEFDKLAWPTADGGFSMNAPELRFDQIMYDPPSGWLDGLTELFKLSPRRPNDPFLQEHYDISAGLQALTDRLILHMVNNLSDITGSSNLCMAGGVALNCVSNRYAFENSAFSNLFVQPAAHDGGLALGAASTVWRSHLEGAPMSRMEHAYLGPTYSDDTICQALQAAGLKFETPSDIAKDVAVLLSEGKIVAHFDGPMEFGPRALGNRSLLADPRDADMRERINRIIKHRELFRPLAPSVLSTHAPDWFVIEKPTPASDFMLVAYPARDKALGQIPAVLHDDNSARIQTVNAEHAPRFANILKHFDRLTGVPMVLNTSYNDQAPIVCSPEDAIEVFLNTPIDALAIGSYLVKK